MHLTQEDIEKWSIQNPPVVRHPTESIIHDRNVTAILIDGKEFTGIMTNYQMANVRGNLVNVKLGFRTPEGITINMDINWDAAPEFINEVCGEDTIPITNWRKEIE